MWLNIKQIEDLDQITQVEKVLGVEFPTDYLENVIKFNGGIPDPGSITFGDQTEVLAQLLSFNKSDGFGYILEQYNALIGQLPDKVIPFGVDPFGNYFCFDYSDIPTDPKIVFWDHEKSYLKAKDELTLVCNNFTELITNLHEVKWD
jgi:SMI1-KNR4 cell-wall